MKNKKRLCTMLLSASACLAIAFAALAEGALSTIYSASTRLLFDTSNVTLTAHAEFTYDEQHFKTFDGKYVQDDFNSLMQVTMTTPPETAIAIRAATQSSPTAKRCMNST